MWLCRQVGGWASLSASWRKELRPTGGVGSSCWGQVHTEAMCSFSELRLGGKGHLDPNNVGFLCSREGRKPHQDRVPAALQGRSRLRMGLGGVQFSTPAGDLWTPPHSGALSPATGWALLGGDGGAYWHPWAEMRLLGLFQALV